MSLKELVMTQKIWTTEVPTEPGVYWVRFVGSAECVLVEVEKIAMPDTPSKFILFVKGSFTLPCIRNMRDNYGPYTPVVHMKNAEWCGPLVPKALNSPKPKPTRSKPMNDQATKDMLNQSRQEILRLRSAGHDLSVAALRSGDEKDRQLMEAVYKWAKVVAKGLAREGD